MKKLLFLPLFTVACVPVQQQKINADIERTSHFAPYELTIDEGEFLKTLNPIYTTHELTVMDRKVDIDQEPMQENFQTGFTIPGYGSIYAGEATRLYDRQAAATHFEIIQDNLLFDIQFGGVGSPAITEYKLIWNGEYYNTAEGLTVDLVLSFKNLDRRRSLSRKSIRYDLMPLKTSDSEIININFLGYNKPIKYQY